MEDTLDFHLLNDFQRDFPVCPRPFAELARRLGVGEGRVIERLEALRSDGKISRVGAVFSPHRFGVSTLAAMAVPPVRLAEVAAIVSGFPEVNHNYEREHRFNLWFVVAAASAVRLQAALAAIEGAAGVPVLVLPLLEEFHIDLGFPLDGCGSRRSHAIARARPLPEALPLDKAEHRLVAVVQEGLPFFMRPFALVAERVGAGEGEVMARIRRWLEEGAIRRFGVVVRHRELGYAANAMLVHNVPEQHVARVGRALAGEPAVTLCYRRPRVLPEWPYNLFCMIHGRERGEVAAAIADLRDRHGLSAYPHEILFSLTRYKQTGARYA